MWFWRRLNCSNESVGPEKEEASFLTRAVNQLAGDKCTLHLHVHRPRHVSVCISEQFKESHLQQRWETMRLLYFSRQFRSAVGGQPWASLTARADGDAKRFFPVTVIGSNEGGRGTCCPLVLFGCFASNRFRKWSFLKF